MVPPKHTREFVAVNDIQIVNSHSNYVIFFIRYISKSCKTHRPKKIL